VYAADLSVAARDSKEGPVSIEENKALVIRELVNRGTSALGKRYENEYCFVFELAGGRIRAVREYLDTEKARVAVSA
jgi:ketosteroid isomerase-like protein